MFDWFKKKQPTVVFEELLPGIKDTYPPIPAMKMERPWLNRMRDSYKQIPKPALSKTTHVARCPGIHKAVGTGFIIRTWQDMVINTYNDGQDCEWDYVTDAVEIANRSYGPAAYGLQELSVHPSEGLADYFNDWPEESCRFLFKYCPPWLAYIPKGYVGMMLPILYSNETRFEILPGAIEAALGPVHHLNVFMRWNVKEGKTLIPAGTPLYQLFVYKQENIKHEVIPHSMELPHPINLAQIEKMSKYLVPYNMIRKKYK